MKRVGNLYKEICSMENLRLAHRNAKRGKGWYKEVVEIGKNPDLYLKLLQETLINHEYHTSKYEQFERQEGKKIRKIYKLPYYPDRIVHWAILQVIEKYLIRNLIPDTYSAIPDRGIHYGIERVVDAIKNDHDGCEYCLKLDVKHYYQSINHDVLKAKYRKIFKDQELLDLLDEIIDSVSTCDDTDFIDIYVSMLDCEDPGSGVGLPIGNYLSQYSANIYLSDFDHWLKEVKHVKHYFRYMDDIVIFSSSKEKLHDLFEDIKEYLKVNLKLKLKDNYQIFPTYVRGVDFLGYRFF